MHWLHRMRKCGLYRRLCLWALGTQGLMNFALCFSLSLTGRQPACLPIADRLGLRSLQTFEPKIAANRGIYSKPLFMLPRKLTLPPAFCQEVLLLSSFWSVVAPTSGPAPPCGALLSTCAGQLPKAYGHKRKYSIS